MPFKAKAAGLKSGLAGVYFLSIGFQESIGRYLERRNCARMRKRFLLLLLSFLVSPASSFAGKDIAVDNYNLGLSLFYKNHYEQALSRFLEAADQNFNSWQSYEMAGYCYFEMRDKDGALEAFEESLRLNPKNTRLVKVYNNLKEGAADIPLRPVVDAGGFLPGT